MRWVLFDEDFLFLVNLWICVSDSVDVAFRLSELLGAEKGCQERVRLGHEKVEKESKMMPTTTVEGKVVAWTTFMLFSVSQPKLNV